jgi:YggT family protein
MFHALINIFILMVLADAMISFVPNPDVQRHPVILQLRKIVDIPLRPIRQLLPPNIPFDPSPIIMILLLRMIEAVL